ncbi:MAG TPA: hypothetical protein VFW96_02480 [Thermomicrobiales bacterium]|nr:hypothetical protein [Thermomicrobiales bacterium]
MVEPATNQPAYEGDPARGILRRVTEGMDVYNPDGGKAGTVSAVFFGAGDESADIHNVERGGRDPNLPGGAGEVTLGAVLGPFGAPDDLPAEVRSRLLRSGYIRVNSAIPFVADRYATPDQIAAVGADRVTLRVPTDDLPKG